MTINKKYYAGIGARKTPPYIMSLMTSIASLLEERGYVLRSGGADGADTAFEKGVELNSNKHIYLPYDGFKHKWVEDNICYKYISKYNINYIPAHQSLIYHPKGFALSSSSQAMMIRNYFQVAGIDNEGWSDFIICWTPEGKDIGGTSQAIRIAKSKSIPVYNLGDPKYNNISSTQLISIILEDLYEN